MSGPRYMQGVFDAPLRTPQLQVTGWLLPLSTNPAPCGVLSHTDSPVHRRTEPRGGASAQAAMLAAQLPSAVAVPTRHG